MHTIESKDDKVKITLELDRSEAQLLRTCLINRWYDTVALDNFHSKMYNLLNDLDETISKPQSDLAFIDLTQEQENQARTMFENTIDKYASVEGVWSYKEGDNEKEN